MMRHFLRILALLGISLVSLSAAFSVLAAPPLPSSFYGTVKVDGENVPDGTLIQAFINGHAYAEKPTQTSQGDSMYLLNVPGDDPGTTVIEGGRDGDTIVFSIAGTQADQTGLWKSGTIIKISLTASAHSTPIAPQKTLTSFPNQTRVVIGMVVVVFLLFIILWSLHGRRLKALK